MYKGGKAETGFLRNDIRSANVTSLGYLRWQSSGWRWLVPDLRFVEQYCSIFQFQQEIRNFLQLQFKAFFFFSWLFTEYPSFSFPALWLNSFVSFRCWTNKCAHLLIDAWYVLIASKWIYDKYFCIIDIAWIYWLI